MAAIAASRPDCVNGHRGGAERQATDRRSRRDVRLTAADEADVGGRPAHVKGQRIHEPGLRRHGRRGDHTGCGAREEGEHGRRSDRVHVGDTPARCHHRDGGGRHASGEPAQMPAHHRRHRRVERAGRGALVLAELRQQVAGHGDRHIQSLRHRLAQALLVAGTCVAEQQADRHSLRRQRSDGVRDALHLGVLQRYHRRPVGPHALVDRDDQVGRHQRFGAHDVQVVQGRTVLATDDEHVAEALGGHQHGPGHVALEHRVGGCRGAVCDGMHRRNAGGSDAGGKTLALVRRRRGHLDRPRGPVAGDEHHVRERPADVDPGGRGCLAARSHGRKCREQMLFARRVAGYRRCVADKEALCRSISRCPVSPC